MFLHMEMHTKHLVANCSVLLFGNDDNCILNPSEWFLCPRMLTSCLVDNFIRKNGIAKAEVISETCNLLCCNCIANE